MAKMDNLFQLCFFYCLFLSLFMIAISIVNDLNLFTPVASGVSIAGKTPDNIFAEITGFHGGMEYVWTALLSATGFIVLIVVKITQSTALIGIYLLSIIFWTSFTKFYSVVNINNWIPSNIITLFVVGSMFIWVGAIIGMLTSN